MRFGRISWLATLVALAAPASASAYFVHVVAPAETLTSVAAADGLSVAQLAAANDLSPSAELIAGQTLQIPPQGYLNGSGGDEQTGAGAQTSETNATASGAAEGTGGYVVQPGDTLSAIAAADGTTVAELAAVNGLNPSAFLISGTTLQLPAEGTATSSTQEQSGTAAGQPVGAGAEGTDGGPPYPTDETVSGSEIADIAQANGVPPALAEAIGWQESGWNNDEVSPDDAIGVMQILPDTWSWIQDSLSVGAPLDPASAADNVRAGTLMLHALLDSTGDDAAEAAAGYYQGLSSVQQNGMYQDTQQYVNDVMSLEQQFGGG